MREEDEKGEADEEKKQREREEERRGERKREENGRRREEQGVGEEDEEGGIKVVEVETDWVKVRRRTKQRRQQGRDEGSAKSGGKGFRGIQIFVKMDHSKAVTMDVAPSDKVSDVMRRASQK